MTSNPTYLILKFLIPLGIFQTWQQLNSHGTEKKNDKCQIQERCKVTKWKLTISLIELQGITKKKE